jgi:hypothetical protein
MAWFQMAAQAKQQEKNGKDEEKQQKNGISHKPNIADARHLSCRAAAGKTVYSVRIVASKTVSAM